jgi:hypothetical protein
MNSVARRIAVAALVLTLAVPASAQIFTDMVGQPQQRILEKLAARGVFPITAARRFAPQEQISRLDFVLALGRAIGVRESRSGTLDYRDVAEIPLDARNLVASMVNSGTVDRRVSSRTVQGVEVILEVDKGTYAPEEIITLRMSVKNTNNQAIELEFPTSLRTDFVIQDLQGREVARWSIGRQFTTQGIRLTVQPSATIRVSDEIQWQQLDQNDRPVPPGRYQLIGVLNTRNNPISVPIFFQKGFVTGFPDNTFRPKAVVSRGDVAEFVVRAAGLDQEAQARRGATLPNPDAADVRPEHRGYVALALQRNLLPVGSDNRIRPNDAASRLDAAVAFDGIMRLLNRYDPIKGRFRAIIGQPGQILEVADGSTLRRYRIANVVAVYRNDRPVTLADLRPNDELEFLGLGEVGEVAYIEAKGP